MYKHRRPMLLSLPNPTRGPLCTVLYYSKKYTQFVVALSKFFVYEHFQISYLKIFRPFFAITKNVPTCRKVFDPLLFLESYNERGFTGLILFEE